MRRGVWLYSYFGGGLSGNPGIAAGLATAGSWRLVRSTTATAGTGEAAILLTADIERSDPGLAGLLLRCGKLGIEAVVVVVETIPPHARPPITSRTRGQESPFAGTIIPADAGIRLPGDATSWVTGPWRTDGGAPIDGIVCLSGLPKALQSLNAECGQK